LTRQSLTTQQQRDQIASLRELVVRRAKDEIEIRQQNLARREDTRREHERLRDQATEDFEREHAKLIATYKEARETVYFQYETAGQSLLQEEQRFAEEARQDHEESLDDIKNSRQSRVKNIEETFKERELAPRTELAQIRKRCELTGGEIDSLFQESQGVLRRRKLALDDPTTLTGMAPNGIATQDYFARVTASLDAVRGQLNSLRGQFSARFVDEGWPILVFVFSAAVCAYPLWRLLQDLGWIVVAAAGVIVPLLLAIGMRQAAIAHSRRQGLRSLADLQQLFAQSRADLGAALKSALAETERTHRRLIEGRDKDLAATQAEADKTREKQLRRHESRRQKTLADFQQRRTLLESSHERQLQQLDERFPSRITQLEQDFERRLGQLGDDYRQSCAANREQFERDWNSLAREWHEGIKRFAEVVDGMNAYCQRRFPPWSGTAEAQTDATAPAADKQVPALCFGRYEFDLARLEGGIPQAEELKVDRTSFELPALLSFPECPSLLLEAEGDGRDVATATIQNVMLRFLSTFPPGKVRFTIIDPVGLGQNFSAFMHLADYDERLVSNRIWTESAHINQRLTDLTEHMENVIQKYLRNEFASIQEYNEHAGEVAEPFQILVVANFPANFSDEAARRLVSIAASGSRCGVYTLISTDEKLKLPRNFDLADLESPAATLAWNIEQRRFFWKYDDLRNLPLTVEAPPGDEKFTELVRKVGRGAKDASRVEVPFEMIVPEEAHWWSSDSRAEIEVPLGRAGAKKLQYMRLGKGTSQHVLISGKTGSGKSTLLNAIITSLAIHYSPDELQFYLIDFKKGVEFKAYATHRLPHARVIAIESEREFGMSVLERLDLELKTRGDLFRKAGVQDLKGYRNVEPTAAVPRILLVIDEFQEFFTTDDRIAHDAALLLDRLVRQGRAFGIHVMLGSQTLAGAYSLARSTIGQMAVRIALQCSESDAHLILSEDNTAARLLSRPGEAIYNDANGLFEGNHPFQVVWLSDALRERYLKQLAERAEQRHVVTPPPTVFEGNAAADPADNPLLCKALEGPATSEPMLAAATTPRAWLGAAVAIKDPTDVLFRRQGGTNLWIVGQQEELGVGILSNCLVGVAAQRPARDLNGDSAEGTRGVFVLDGTRPESPDAGFWQKFQRRVPIDATIVPPRDVVKTVVRIAEEVERRMAAGDSTVEPLFLVIYNVSRFRDLRKSDDFGMSSFDDDDAQPVNGGKQLSTILREGPAVGVHTLVWCDSYNNVNRWFDRSTLRDFEMRVLFQMNATDSANLMDSPAASKLGSHMAIFYSEEHGHAEKFRPYGMPTAEWLEWAGSRLAGRATDPQPL